MSRGSWDAANPNALVVACSDGRFQEELDAFLRAELALRQYDRLYVPGGAGGLRKRVRTGLGDSSNANQTKNR